MGSAELRPFRASTFHHTTSKVERGEAQQPTTGRFRQSRRRICRAEIRRTEGVEASALGRETRWSTGTAREPVTQRVTLLRRGLKLENESAANISSASAIVKDYHARVAHD